jgi:hypothetical protein
MSSTGAVWFPPDGGPLLRLKGVAKGGVHDIIVDRTKRYGARDASSHRGHRVPIQSGQRENLA